MVVRNLMRFSDVAKGVAAKPGIYEIHTIEGIPLKVGIAGNLRKRLLQHGTSRQSGLRFKAGDSASSPAGVESKRSILAKHLYFDSSIAPGYDLRTEIGRRRFLEDRCRFSIELTVSRSRAREIEKKRERSQPFRYLGRVVKR
jgi:hypothetical protein